MKKIAIFTSGIVAIYMLLTGTALAAGIENGEILGKLGLSKKVAPVFQIQSAKVEIQIGLSEIQKKEIKRSKRVQIASVAQDRAISENMSLGDLRVLYQEAAQKYNISWKLVEAVHQVESGKSTSNCKKSFAGATGPMQFMSGTFKKYSEGGSICDLRASVFAAANLLSKSGASAGRIDDALYSYNHSSAYVAKVKRVMDGI
jgi:membrane-bound lytic murein transglycosylase B